MRIDVVIVVLEVHAFQSDAVVVAADEAVGDQHVLRIAGIDAVVIPHS